VLLSTDDSPYRPSAPSPGVCGYLVLLRADGDLEVRRVTDGVATVLAASTGGAPLVAGTWTRLSVTVTGAGLTAAAGSAEGTLTAADTTHRPVPVVHLGGTRAAVRFRDVELT
jgi:glycerophosphoryl diester phosphodiesterase